ncbi:MAG: hypothetical protein ACTSYX_02255 [Candidatus Thorarchaeota archaeon]
MKKTTSMLIMALLVLSVAAAVGMASAQSEEPYIRVQWQEADEVHPFEHTDKNSQWIFGPQPSILVTYAENGTDIADCDYHVAVDVELYINITIPKSFLGEGNELDSVLFWASGHRPRSPLFVLQYNATADEWNKLSFSYQPGQEEPTPSDFLFLNRTDSSYKVTTEYYVIVFAITFVQDVGPAVFWTGMQATDTNGRPVSPSWLARISSGRYESPPLGLGVHVPPQEFRLPDYYYADIVDLEGNVIHYVQVNQSFTVRLRATTQIGEVLIPFATLTYNSSYAVMTNLTMIDDFNNLYDKNAHFNTQEVPFYPTMFLRHNATHTWVDIGYLNITWNWIEFAASSGVWLPAFDIVRNDTLDLSVYFVVDTDLTKTYEGGFGVMWTGYFTNMTDMDLDPREGRIGAVLNPEMGLCKVLDLNGDPITPRPEIRDLQTMKLAFEKGLAEGFVYDTNGDLVDRVLQGETLNLTLVVHARSEFINGTYYYSAYGLDRKVDSLLANMTITVGGEGTGMNDTHYWRYTVTHTMVFDFETNTSTTYSNHSMYVYERGGGMVDHRTVVTVGLNVTDFHVEVSANATTMTALFYFLPDAPSIVLDSASVQVGIVQNTYYFNGVVWTQNHWSNGSPIEDFIDQLHYYDLTNDLFWSPRHLIVGDVEIWKPPVWTLTPEGAIDLDGNLFTTEDQYFVKRTGTWHDEGNVTVEGMTVGVMFDPSPAEAGDEFHSWSWMGVLRLIIEFDAKEEFFWFHADDFSPVNATEMAQIQETMWADMANDIPKPGYEWVAWLSKNRTIDLTEITGLDDNVWETTWFAWGTQQWFKVSTSATSMTWASFRAKYAGLLLFKDSPEGASPSAPDFAIEDGKVVTDEVTHVVLIDDVGSVELRKPFGATNSSGDVRVSPDTEVSFGITIREVNVTLFPLQVANADGLRGPWDLRQSYEGSLGLDPTDFDHWISHAQVTEMSFDITFNVDMVQYNPDDPTTWNHAVSFKVDQRFGNWTLDEFNNTVLEDYGLAVNFFGILGTATRTTYRAGEQPITDTNSNSVNASYYQFGAEDSPFANVTMGGLPYTWGGDNFTNTYISGSSTAPIGAFSLIYESQSGETITDWNVEASMLFMTAGYDHWGGHEIRCDPVFVSYTSAYYGAGETTTTTTTSTTTSTSTTETTTSTTGSTTTTGGPTGPTTGTLGTYVLVGGGIAVIVIILALTRRRR